MTKDEESCGNSSRVLSYGCSKKLLDILKSLSIFKNVEDALKCMKPISVALDSLQSDKCSIAGAVEEWKKLLTCFREMGDAREWLEIVEKTYEKSVPKVWFLANVLHPQYVGASLTKKNERMPKIAFRNIILISYQTS